MKPPAALHLMFAAAAAAVGVMATAVTAKRVPPADAGDPLGTDPGSGDPSFPPTLTRTAVRDYALVGCTDVEIADRFLTDPASIQCDHADVLRSTRALRRYLVRKTQTDILLKHSASIATWLGRNELGQSSNPTSPGLQEPRVNDDAPPVDD